MDPALLRHQIMAESSGNPNAVSNQGAQGISQFIPSTAKQYGVNVTDPASSIDGQAHYMSDLLDQNKGDVRGALLGYHGGPGPKGNAYADKILTAYSGRQGSQMPNQTQSSGDPFLDMLQDAAKTSKPATKAVAPSQPATDDPFMAMLQDAVKNPDAGPAPVKATPQQIEAQTKPAQDLSAGDSFARGAAAIPKGVYQGFRAVTDTGLKYAGKGLDAAGVGPGNLEAQADANAAQAKGDFNAQYGGNDLASRMGQGGNIAGQIAATSPVLGAKVIQGGGMLANAANGAVQGGAFNALTSSQNTDDSLLKQTATGAGIGAAGNALIGKLAQTQVGKDVIKGVGGLFKQGAEASGANALAEKLGLRAPNASTLPPVNATGPEMASAREAAAVRQADQAAADKAAAAQASAAKPRYKMNTDGTTTQLPAVQADPVPAAPIPTFTPPQAPATGASGSAQKAQNQKVLEAIGLDTSRPSALTGDKRSAGVEYQQSKLQTPQGEILNDQLQKEQGALKGYGQKIIADTGATAQAPEQVGQAVRAPLQGLSDHYDAKIGDLYKQADQRAAGAAVVEPKEFGDLLGTNSQFAGKAENNQLRRGIRAYAKEQGMIGEDGTLQPMDVKTAEGMRQYLNSQWSPQNSGLIGKIKQSLDADVGRAGGADIYSQARALHAERANTLDNPNGISSLLKEQGPNGINQAVPDEKVGAKILTMPTNQFQHVVSTLKNLPEELQPQGQQALNEIKGQIAKKIYAAGDSGGTQAGPSNWNAANVTRELNAQRSKMAEVFTPEEIQNFATLHDAGHILQAPSAYPGAAVQGHNLAQKGLLYGASPTGLAFIGGHLAGPAGAMAGASLGAAANNKLAQAFEQNAANRLRESMKLR